MPRHLAKPVGSVWGRKQLRCWSACRGEGSWRLNGPCVQVAQCSGFQGSSPGGCHVTPATVSTVPHAGVVLSVWPLVLLALQRLTGTGGFADQCAWPLPVQRAGKQ